MLRFFFSQLRMYQTLKSFRFGIPNFIFLILPLNSEVWIIRLRCVTIKMCERPKCFVQNMCVGITSYTKRQSESWIIITGKLRSI